MMIDMLRPTQYLKQVFKKFMLLAQHNSTNINDALARLGAYDVLPEDLKRLLDTISNNALHHQIRKVFLFLCRATRRMSPGLPDYLATCFGLWDTLDYCPTPRNPPQGEPGHMEA